MTIKEIVEKIVGPVLPVGESHTDKDRLENLDELISLTEDLLGDIRAVADGRNHHLDSVKKAGQVAHAFLEEVNSTHLD